MNVKLLVENVFHNINSIYPTHSLNEISLYNPNSLLTVTIGGILTKWFDVTQFFIAVNVRHLRLSLTRYVSKKRSWSSLHHSVHRFRSSILLRTGQVSLVHFDHLALTPTLNPIQSLTIHFQHEILCLKIPFIKCQPFSRLRVQIKSD